MVHLGVEARSGVTPPNSSSNTGGCYKCTAGQVFRRMR